MAGVWKFQARHHDARQPLIRDELIEALNAGACKSYQALAKYINYWCSDDTTEAWLRSFPGFEMYAANINPGLTEQNRTKQVNFARWEFTITHSCANLTFLLSACKASS